MAILGGFLFFSNEKVSQSRRKIQQIVVFF